MAKHNLDLPEDARDTAVAFSIAKRIAPYAREYYGVLKRPGETLGEFIARHFCERCVRWKASQLMADQQKLNRKQEMLDQAELQNQAGVILDPEAAS